MKLKMIPLLVLFVGAFGSAALAQTSEVRGKVVDEADNPIKGAVVRFVNKTSTQVSYDAKTNKKGTYFLPALLYYSPGEWDVTIEAEGFTPLKISVESRRSDRTLLGEPYTTGIAADRPHMVRIMGFGKAEIDFVMRAGGAQPQLERKVGETADLGLPAGAPQASSKDPYAIASNKAAAGDLEGSLPDFEAAIAAEPDDVERRELHAKVLFNLGRHAEAQAAIEGAIERAPDNAAFHTLRADALIKQERWDEAMAALDTAGSLAPDDLKIVERRALVAERTGDAEAAVAANEALVASNPADLSAWLALGHFYAESGQQDKAQAAFDRVVELDPENAYKTFFNIATLLENKKNVTDAEQRRAIEAYRKAIEIKPDYAKARLALAYALLRTGDQSGAREQFEAFVELAPDSGEAAQIRGLISALPQR